MVEMRAESNRERGREEKSQVDARKNLINCSCQKTPPKKTHKGLGLMKAILTYRTVVSVEHRKSPLLSEPYSCSPTYEEDSAHYWRMSCWGGRLLGTYLPTLPTSSDQRGWLVSRGGGGGCHVQMLLMSWSFVPSS